MKQLTLICQKCGTQIKTSNPDKIAYLSAAYDSNSCECPFCHSNKFHFSLKGIIAPEEVID